jgi:heat-inducible transcriptional repressor
LSVLGESPVAPPRLPSVLSERQELILRLAVEAYLASGRPVPSKDVAERPEIEWGPSTVRAELAALEAAGYLTHPHTSAGRVPTDAGYRLYVDSMVESGSTASEPSVGLELSRLRREVDTAMRETTVALAEVTDLMAMATAPEPSLAATIHRVEVLQLRPNKIVVIGIASTGDVTRRVFEFRHPVDRGLVEWASSYLNESLSGLGVGARMIESRLADPALGRIEADFIATLGAAFTEFVAEGDLYVEGTSRLLSDAHLPDLPRADELMTALERRAEVLAMLRSSLDRRSVFFWIGAENPQPALRSASVIGANYGLPHRNLGAVGVVGPLRMDYATAIASVRFAARELSRYFETVYSN